MQSDSIITDPETGELRSVFNMHRISERFDALTRDPRILGMVRQLLGSDVYVHQSRINDKFGFQGNGFNWHSDFETWHSEDGMPRMRALSASLMLTDNNEFNGPLMLMPGSHHYFVPCIEQTPEDNWKRSLKTQRIGVPEQTVLQDLANRGGIQAPKGPPGSLLLFERNTLHASNKNLSPWPRSNLFFVYNSVDNALEAPYCGNEPRPEFLAARKNVGRLICAIPGKRYRCQSRPVRPRGWSLFNSRPASLHEKAAPVARLFIHLLVLENRCSRSFSRLHTLASAMRQQLRHFRRQVYSHVDEFTVRNGLLERAGYCP